MNLDSFDEDAFDRIETMVDLTPTRAMIRDALAELSLADRELIGWRVVDQLNYDVIAERLGCKRATARVRVSRALATLRSRLDLASGDGAAQ